MATLQVDERFVEAVGEMRALQRQYFRGNKSVIDQAKALEALVDRWLSSIHNPDLFPPDRV